MLHPGIPGHQTGTHGTRSDAPGLAPKDQGDGSSGGAPCRQPPLDVIRNSLADLTSEEDQGEVADLIIEELRRLHEGVLARYRLRPAEFQHWRDVQGYR